MLVVLGERWVVLATDSERFMVKRIVGVSVMWEIPIELASMVRDYDSINEIEYDKKLGEYRFKLSEDTLMQTPEMDYLEKHDYSIKAIGGKGRIYVAKE